MHHTESREYERILLNSSGLLDVRAPIEFNQGAFPQAENLPLLNDEERHRVGICYKQNGQQQAIEFGHKLVSGDIKQHRIEQWIHYSKQHKDIYLYCFRGGMRSKISQQWLHESGIEITRVHGGYKALRRFLVKQLEQADQQFNFIIIGGLTGCRKTELIQQTNNGIDLEGAAYHRGSSFGAHASPPSSQINFENQVAINLLKVKIDCHSIVNLEDESRFIGSVDIPKNIFLKMRNSPLVVVERTLEERLQQLLKEYVINMEQEFSALYEDPDIAFQEFADYLLNSLLRIRKRLGMENWQKQHQSMQFAIANHRKHRDLSTHMQWLEPLLTEYYDPMYLSQLDKRKDSIVFRGSYHGCHQYLLDASTKSNSAQV